MRFLILIEFSPFLKLAFIRWNNKLSISSQQSVAVGTIQELAEILLLHYCPWLKIKETSSRLQWSLCWLLAQEKQKSRCIISTATWAFTVLFLCSFPCVGVCKEMVQSQPNSLCHLYLMSRENQRSITKYTAFSCIAWKPQIVALFCLWECGFLEKWPLSYNYFPFVIIFQWLRSWRLHNLSLEFLQLHPSAQHKSIFICH